MRKKYICKVATLLLMLSVFLGVMTGCGQKKVNPQAVIDGSGKPFETSATVVFNDMKIDMRLIKRGDDLYGMEILSPETVSGMTFLYDNGNMKVKYKGLAFTIDPEKFPANMLAKTIVQCMDSAFDVDSVNVSMKEDSYVIEGKNDTGPFSVRIDPSSGNILSISVPDENFKADFTNFLFLPDMAQQNENAD